MDKFLNIEEKPTKTNILELINKKELSKATEIVSDAKVSKALTEATVSEATVSEATVSETVSDAKEATETVSEAKVSKALSEATEKVSEAKEATVSKALSEATVSKALSEATATVSEVTEAKLLDQEMENLEKDFKKIDNRKIKKTKKEELLLRIFKILNYDVDQLEELTSITIQRDLLKGKKITEKILELVPELREVYNSAYLTCLHDNSIYKQKFPVINLIRQILKCNFLLMTPKVVSNGYEKVTGKKLVTRIFVIEKELF
jgi:hypothetical protein